MAAVTFLGAAQEVTGSCHLVNAEGLGNVLLDCGMHQGGNAVKRLRSESFDFNPVDIDAVILSHAHLDHSGLLPKLVADGFTGTIYCTSATADLLPIMLYDAVGLYERDLERDNRKRRQRGEEPWPAAWSKADVAATLELLDPTPYRQTKRIHGHAAVRFHDAGHILGSAIIELTVTEDAKDKTLVYSGDLGKRNTVLMNDPAMLNKADLVLMESTYGNRNHRDYGDTIEQLSGILQTTWASNGSVMIPSFAVGRTQEIIYHLGMLYHAGKLDPWEIYLDSPMAIEVTAVYDRWLRQLDKEDIKELDDAGRNSLESFLPTLNLSVTSDESMAINRIDKGVIVIAGSGMCTGGRIKHHFKHRIWQDRNTVIFCGFQANGTLGRRIVNGEEGIRMFGEDFVVRANVETLGGFSAHAGQSGLLEWADNFATDTPFVLVHGEPDAMKVLQKMLNKKNITATIPGAGESIEF